MGAGSDAPARRAHLRRAGIVLLALAAVLGAAIACGGSSPSPGGQPPDATTVADGAVLPVLTNHTLAVGENRFSLMLVDRDDVPVLDADARLAFYDLNGEQPVFKTEIDARFIPVELFLNSEQSGKEKRLQSGTGVYVARVTFDTAGRWSTQVSLVTAGGSRQELIPFQFEVLEESPEPDEGDPAPPSRQLTLADVADVTEIDSSLTPRAYMHDITIADALATGKPVVVAFATPALCQTRTCGPVLDTIMDPLHDEFGARAIFIHVEPYELRELRDGVARVPVEARTEWGLQTEPWLFVIGKDGRIAAKFEGVAALDEVEATLRQALEEA